MEILPFLCFSLRTHSLFTLLFFWIEKELEENFCSAPLYHTISATTTTAVWGKRFQTLKSIVLKFRNILSKLPNKTFEV